METRQTCSYNKQQRSHLKYIDEQKIPLINALIQRFQSSLKRKIQLAYDMIPYDMIPFTFLYVLLI